MRPARARDRALDGEGYFAVSPYPTDGHPLPWTWFLHAKPRPEANRLRADLRADSFTLRINDEIAEAGAPVGPVCAWGLYAATEAAGGAQARFSRVRLWVG
ncbi:MAG: hypothetical protein M5R40_14685 [Anaerolineae bacterium]|nr:hypothetical protein [Anaerolineae bacterium]